LIHARRDIEATTILEPADDYLDRRPEFRSPHLKKAWAADLAILEPITHETEIVPIPNMLGTGQLMNTLSVHNLMLDQKGRVWMTMLGGEGQPQEACENPKNKFVKYFPNQSKTTRRVSMYDPATWKGRGLWSNYAEVPLGHKEDGFGAYGKMVQCQIRSDPLAH
jgi:hypothetical protein